MNPTIAEVTSAFMAPSGILVVALTLAAKDQLRAAVSLLGLVVAILWGVCSAEVLWVYSEMLHGLSPRFPSTTLGAVPWVFVIFWTIALLVNVLRWRESHKR
jgi:hypothetical protein